MKKVFLVALLLSNWFISLAQNIGIGTSSPHASAQLDIASNNKGLLVPRMSSASINAIGNPAKGLLVYDSTKNQLMVNMGTPASPEWRTVVYKSGWNITGNSGINPATDFIGTVDNHPLQFRVNNKPAGKLDSATQATFLGYGAGGNASGYNTVAIGYKSLSSNTTGYGNLAIGNSALFSNTSGWENTAIGDSTLYSNGIGRYNVAVGKHALFSNLVAYNSALGYAALKNNSTGNSNLAAGAYALYSNYSGGYNTALGPWALYSNTSGTHNCAIGSSLYQNTTGSYNVASGYGALRDNTTGSSNVVAGAFAFEINTAGAGNTAIGYDALDLTTASNYNVALGYQAGRGFNHGWNNTFIGAGTNVQGTGYFNAIALGNSTTATASNQARIGNTSTTSIGGYTGWSNISDGRYKKNISEDVKGLAFVLKLRPVTYQLDISGLSKKLRENESGTWNEDMQTAMAEKEKMVQSGFVAQEVEQAAKELGYDFSGVDKPKNQNDLYGLRYAEFVVPLVKAVQEQQQIIRSQQTAINELKEMVDELRKQISNK